MSDKLKKISINFISTGQNVYFENVSDEFFKTFGDNSTFYVIELSDDKNTSVIYNAKDIDNIWIEDMNDEA